MKLLAAPAVAAVVMLVAFPVLFATGDDPGIGCAADANLPAILATIRHLESGGDYAAQSRGSTASGAYQFLDSTWADHAGFRRAWLAPPDTQDAKAIELIDTILDRHDGDVTAIPVVWYIGRVPAPGSSDWDTVPVPEAGNRLTPRQYQQRWLNELDRQLAASGDDATIPSPACVAGQGIAPLPDGFAYPAPVELFATAPVGEPHHDYPAWDWMLPIGTPLYAVRPGRVVTVQYWPHNWWDHGCTTNSTQCRTCGIGVTIEDDTGTRWAYCHGAAVHVTVGTHVDAGTQILTSGNTGRSSGAHLHLQIRTRDGQLRCPQPLMRALRDRAGGIDSNHLPISGCTF